MFFRLLFLLSLCLPFYSQAERPVKMATLNFEPFIWCEDNAVNGLYVDIIAKLFERIGKQYSIECFPWKRALYELKSGNADVLFAAVKTAEREKFAFYSRIPIRVGRYSIFTKKGRSFKFDDVSDLFGKTVAITRGHSVSVDFDNAVKRGDIKVIEVKTTKLGFKVLMAGRVDAYINDKIVGLFEADRLSLISEITLLIKPVQESNPAYFLFSKTSDMSNKQKLLSEVDKQLELMWEDGTIEDIYRDYIDKLYVAINQ